MDAALPIDVDICIVGGGPAGITLARELAVGPARLAIFESGGGGHDESVQELSASTTDSAYHAADALTHGRHRQIGGTSNLWIYDNSPSSGRTFARSVLPESIDLEPRTGDDTGGWPMGIDALMPVYERAHRLWAGTPFDYHPSTWSDDRHPPLSFGSPTIRTSLCHLAPKDAWTHHWDAVQRVETVSVHPYTTVLSLHGDGATGRIREATVARRDGSLSRIRARFFVLAAGGVENAQILLHSDVTVPGAVGNRHDQVGRYLMDHPEFRIGTLIPESPDLMERIGLYDMRLVGSSLVNAFLTIAPDIKRQESLRNMSAALTPQRPGFGSPADRSLSALAVLRRRRLPSNVRHHGWTLIAAAGDTAALLRRYHRDFEEYRGGWSQPDVDRRAYDRIELWGATEQTPDVKNRVTLSSARDRLGRQRIHLNWLWSEADRVSATRSMGILAEGIREAGHGTVLPWADLQGTERPRLGAIHHPMGSTRMHVDPSHGVVDTDCRVHGLDNLYVAGSSVFPTGLGYANPTLTVVALAVRLADHLKERIGR